MQKNQGENTVRESIQRIGTRLTVLFALAGACAPDASAQTTPHPILFVTVFPLRNDFATIGAVFATHSATPSAAGRGGDLWIRYGDGTLRNITRQAGLGIAGVDQNSPNAIAVRDVAVHWNATRAVFSLAQGSPAYWQLYEVSGPGLSNPQGALTLAKVPNQPPDYNNIEPTYASDGSLIFTSDRPRNGARHLYPQQDEYESTATVTGLWKLDPVSGALMLMNHAPSGAFNPMVDSFGRVVFTRWDHMERDQQEGPNTFNWHDETNATVTIPSTGTDVFPEHKFTPLPNQNEHAFNFFFPWEIKQDGSGEEVLNHLGRHELGRFFFRRLTDDPRLVDFAAQGESRLDDDGGLLHIAESARQPGCFIATDADEFGRHAAGRLVRWCATPTTNAEDIELTQLTANNTGSYRDPLVLDDAGATVIASYTSAQNLVSGRDGVDPTYRFRLRRLIAGPGGKLVAEAGTLTDDQTMRRNITFANLAYDGPMWEFSPVEVRARATPPTTGFALRAPEAAAFQQTGVDPEQFREFLRARDLGLIVIRDVTSRDDADRQQPFNLRVPGGRTTLERNAQGQVVPGKVYDIGYMQFFQGDQVRGYYDPARGRRVIARHLNDTSAVAENFHAVSTPPASVPVALDGSAVAVVPARRALSWQSLAPAPGHEPVVLERYWITLQPGEIRACEGCHGSNRLDQARQPASTQTAQALVAFLNQWKQANPIDRLLRDSFE